MRLNLLGHFITSLVTLFFLWPTIAPNQDSPVAPLEIQLIVDKTSLDLGESNQAILTLNNTTSYTLTNVTAQLEGTAFAIVDSTVLPDTLTPSGSAQVKYTLKSQSAGSQYAIFTVGYLWNDSNSGLAHHRIETVNSGKIEVTDRFDFEWPSYLIPLLVGFVIGQFGSWLNDRRKRLTEDKQRKEQAKGVTLAILQAARKGVEKKERVSFNLWEDAIVRGNLYPALHQLGRAIGKPELSKQLAELSIVIADYNDRYDNNSLTEDFTLDIVDELTDLIDTIESKNSHFLIPCKEYSDNQGRKENTHVEND